MKKRRKRFCEVERKMRKKTKTALSLFFSVSFLLLSLCPRRVAFFHRVFSPTMDNPGASGDDAPAYAHPWTALFYAFFKVRKRQKQDDGFVVVDVFLMPSIFVAFFSLTHSPLSLSLSLSRPLFLSFQISSLVVYVLCGLFSKSFVANFVVVIVLLMADFWTVR